jgi:hypothetical protein
MSPKKKVKDLLDVKKPIIEILNVSGAELQKIVNNIHTTVETSGMKYDPNGWRDE